MMNERVQSEIPAENDSASRRIAEVIRDIRQTVNRLEKQLNLSQQKSPMSHKDGLDAGELSALKASNVMSSPAKLTDQGEAAHDLRACVSIVHSAVSLFAIVSGAGEQIAMLEIISRNTKVLERIVRQLIKTHNHRLLTSELADYLLITSGRLNQFLEQAGAAYRQ